MSKNKEISIKSENNEIKNKLKRFLSNKLSK